MSDKTNDLTVDEAVTEYLKAARERYESLPPRPEAPPAAPATFEEAEAECFRLAEHILSQMCPDPGTCSDRRCRRDRLCRHIVDLRTMREGPDPEPLSRRSRGARAVRHAIWVVVNARLRDA
ncbi:MAG TPA: hypothetical protein VHL09_06410 [Dehalococcoidia bacterium]|nr:hypothetical protein [Dehalococcoidia bacterium]